MAGFTSPLDIGNRALQHCGASRVSDLSDSSSRGAAEISFCYDKLRQAELQRHIWTFATSRQVLRAIDAGTMRLAPSLWSPLTTYFVDSIVADQSGDFWISLTPNNLNNDPLLTICWEPYFGPLSVSRYDTSGTTGYFAGELVYTTPGDGTALVYKSLQDNNSDVPGTATPYDATVTYSKNQVVTFSSVAYMSLINLNLNNEPDLAPALWAIGTTYAIGNKVGGSDGVIYQSIGSGNIGHDPTIDAGVHWTNTGVLNPWTTVFVGGKGSVKWLLIGGSAFPAGVGLTTLTTSYPVGVGPASQTETKNAFLKPAGFMRLCPQNPKPGMGALGGPTGNVSNDWLIERGLIISTDTGPIPIRFVANFTDVARMEPDFCEAVAVRIAFAICNTVTQDKALIQLIAKTFRQWESDAINIDGIEQGYIEADEDDLITVRL